ncbi:uncharacterized protein LOC114296998 isoform X2 [Camellia sinensis]|uniref:uncharacterized protein LOC114296998 isoform X2 n=1 Tax=Camellia sinensis TaxID=4442 RepID=UPI001036B019|nr:uncharacterized protein LOC114296998 isoform X2 [Camellia sinensis]
MAAHTHANGEFWLPSEFLTDDDILMGKENFNKNALNSAFGPTFAFPTDFPYDFGSYSPVESVVGSTETESDEEDLLAGLTRRLARFTLQERAQKMASAPQNLESWVLSGSPQSTLSAFESPNGPSPPTTPPGGNNDSWDLIYEAAGQVARLKMNDEGPPKPRGLLGPPWSLAPPPLKNINTSFYANQCLSHNLSQSNHFEQARHDQMMKHQCSSLIWGRQTREGLFSQQNQLQQQMMGQNRGGRVVNGGGFENNNGRYARPLGLPQSAWPPLQVQHKNHQAQPSQHGSSGMRAVFLGGSGVKRECAGTGVFLPRRYGNNTTEPRKKTGCSTALLPARVVQALNKNFDHMTVQAQVQAQAQARSNGSFIPDYDTLMMPRANAALTHQNRILRPEGGMNHELSLPQEWTY